ncbi:FeoC-like transcriptional regulator [Propionibacteriaceae bacterium Y1923]|uniref:FeoC-like transcriptional regulator n=1 Tax=Aestuariimicrobium sp. Y1814 TaxID=3418742 RepID=UPI003C209C1A
MSGPLLLVHRAVQAGARTQGEVVADTRLAPDVVAAALEHLVRTGRVATLPLVAGCPAQGCGSCPLAPASPGRTGRCAQSPRASS